MYIMESSEYIVTMMYHKLFIIGILYIVTTKSQMICHKLFVIETKKTANNLSQIIYHYCNLNSCSIVCAILIVPTILQQKLYSAIKEMMVEYFR